MTDRNPPALEDVFRTLDRWRHLPAYRLEPNLAPFFGLFLCDILRECLETKLGTRPIIIPEFPLHKGVLFKKTCTEADERGAFGEGDDNHLSVNVDYIVFSQPLDKVYLVELKTDMASVRDKQIKYLKKAREADFDDLLKGLIKICETTAYKQKYIHLLHHLESIKLVTPLNIEDGKLYEKTFPKIERGWTKVFQCNPNLENSPLEKDVVYITPTGNTDKLKEAGFHEIGFECVAETVWKRGGIGREFAYYLRKWIEPAGVADPRKFRAVP